MGAGGGARGDSVAKRNNDLGRFRAWTDAKQDKYERKRNRVDGIHPIKPEYAYRKND
jgi:hypothetical protein